MVAVCTRSRETLQGEERIKVSSNGKTYWFPDSVTITDFIKMTEVSAFRHAWFVLDDRTDEVLKDRVDMEHVIDAYMESLKG